MKKKMRNLFIVMAVLVMALTFTACENAEEEATKAVDTAFTVLQTGDLETIENEIEGIGELSDMFATDAGDEAGLTAEQGKAFFNSLFSNMTYEIQGTEKVDDSTVNVTVKVTNVNMVTVFTQWSSDVFTIAYENYQKSEDELMALIMDAFTQQVAATVEAGDMAEQTIVMPVIKVDDKWTISPDSDALNAMTGGFTNVANTLSE